MERPVSKLKEGAVMGPSWLLSEKLFKDRRDAGRQLAAQLRRFRNTAPVVLGLPRGGVPVADEVAKELDAPLDVCVVRKIGAPMEPELGIGAVAEGGALWVNREAMELVGVSEAQLTKLIAAQRAEVDARVERFRKGAPPLDLRGKIVLVVDDGIATGGTARAAIETLRARGASQVVLAVPVGASDSIDDLSEVADAVVCPHAEDSFFAVGQWYDDFTATTDEEVVEILEQARSERAAAPREEASRKRMATPTHRNVRIPVGAQKLEGQLSIVPQARGLVVFAHGSGSGRHSPRNQFVAGELQRQGLATLLLDLLSQEEEVIDSLTGHLRFDIGLLASRLVAATEWARKDEDTKDLDVGYFGASTGAAAALIGAAERPELVHAVVSRGGRPDLAEDSLPKVKAPTLLIIGAADREVVRLNRDAFEELRCEKEIEIVPHATHLFPEPGALERVAELAGAWFTRHLGAAVQPTTHLHA
jgi:putative phosphoribosyl transferase